MKEQRLIFRDILKGEFEAKGVKSTIDKRRIIKDVLGYTPPLSAMKEQEYRKVINYVKERSSEELDSGIIAWAYMVELEDGLSKRQIKNLLEMVPSDVEVFPFTLDEGVSLSANSMAIGFLNNDYFDELSDIKRILARVCNDWKYERKDNTYELTNRKKAYMICDFETVFAKE